MYISHPPMTINELMDNALFLKGKTISYLASLKGVIPPKSLYRDKGWIGQLIEWHLGADAANLAKPDFTNLNIELKTLPFNQKMVPKESTFICSAPADIDALTETWLTSVVRSKLHKILWIPIEANPLIPISERRVGQAKLWTLTPDFDELFRQDWEELTSMLHLGEADILSAKYGNYLQIRPKAAHSKILTKLYNQAGESMYTVPKGFYLRRAFTQTLFQEHADEIF